MLSAWQVRAGVRNSEKADTYLTIAASYGLLSKDELARLTVRAPGALAFGQLGDGCMDVSVGCRGRRPLPQCCLLNLLPSHRPCISPPLQVVECDLEAPETIPAALGSAAKVVCAVGAAESELGDIGGPRRIDGEGSTALVQAASAAGVEQFVLVTSLGTGKVGFPAGILNLFGGATEGQPTAAAEPLLLGSLCLECLFGCRAAGLVALSACLPMCPALCPLSSPAGVLVFKRKAEEALEASGMPYVIVRPGEFS